MSSTGEALTGFSMGSIEGAGDFFLSNRASPLKVGLNNLSTTVAVLFVMAQVSHSLVVF